MTSQDILKVAVGIIGWMIKEELGWLIEQASTRRTIIEIGSWKGRSTKAIALSTLGTVYSVDHWLEGAVPVSVKRTWDSDWLEVSYNGSGTVKAEFMRNLAPELASGKCVMVGVESRKGVARVAALLGGKKADMIFVDGDHEYEMVKEDIELWRPMLAEGGLLCGHDYPWPGVCKAVAELVPNHRFLHGTSIWYASGE